MIRFFYLASAPPFSKLTRLTHRRILRWEQADLENPLLHVRRLKNGSSATHLLTGRELRALRRLQREQEPKSPFVFISEPGAPFSKRGFQALVERAGEVWQTKASIRGHDAPPVEMRICTRFRRSEEKADDGLPSHLGYPPAMIVRILAAWPLMLFSRPVGTLP